MSYIDRYRQAVRQIAYRRAWARRDLEAILAPYTVKG